MNQRGIVTGLVLLAIAACGADNAGGGVRRGGGNAPGNVPGSGGPNSTGLIVPSSTGNSGTTVIAQAGSGATGVKLDPNVCASAKVAATRITPEVYFVIDGSGSMNADFGGGTRWTVLRDALVGPNGVVTKLEGVVKFGMATYANNNPMSCPDMTEVPTALSNLSAMNAAYPAQEIGGGTPTGEALQKVVDGLPEFGALDSTERPPIIILATDGEPNGCNSPGGCNWAADWAACLGSLGAQLAAAPATYESTLAAVRAAREKNISVWVISLADGLNNIPDLQRTANIGAGLAEDASPGATIYSPKNPDDLTQTLTQLIGDAVTCDISLAGTLDVGRACEGLVQVNSTTLDCNSDEGWKALDASHISLQGKACERFKSDPSVMLNATFPCDVVDLK
ncbi:MAG TPA: vWA domain-containing protein [Polyangiales bacterium]|nr:vWA domain-containing protein [Polyangiales bacterium]